MSAWHEEDIELFGKLGITPELLRKTNIEPVTGCDARFKYGIVSSGEMSGIAIPFHGNECMARRGH